MKLEDMRKMISAHPDFRDEQPDIAHFLTRKGHGCIFVFKFHCELNPIEKCWTQAKGYMYTRAHTNFTIQRLRLIIPDSLDSENYYRKARNYMFA